MIFNSSVNFLTLALMNIENISNFSTGEYKYDFGALF